MSQLVPPHASNELKILALGGDALNSELKKTDSMDKLFCSSREFGDLIMLGIGGFTPLEGFMGKADWLSVCKNMALDNGTFWPIPITLSTDNEDLKVGQEVAIVYEKNNAVIATMLISEKYLIDKELEYFIAL